LFEPAHADHRCRDKQAPAVPVEFAGLAAE